MPTGDRLTVEIASSAEELQTGLMYRDQLEPDHGMLFLHPEMGRYPVWMANTRIPLDIVWLDSRGRVVEFCERARPYSLARRGGHKDSMFTLELPSGQAERFGLLPGAILPNFAIEKGRSLALPIALIAALAVWAVVR